MSGPLARRHEPEAIVVRAGVYRRIAVTGESRAGGWRTVHTRKDLLLRGSGSGFFELGAYPSRSRDRLAAMSAAQRQRWLHQR